jgi:hypothetical protein
MMNTYNPALDRKAWCPKLDFHLLQDAALIAALVNVGICLLIYLNIVRAPGRRAHHEWHGSERAEMGAPLAAAASAPPVDHTGRVCNSGPLICITWRNTGIQWTNKWETRWSRCNSVPCRSHGFQRELLVRALPIIRCLFLLGQVAYPIFGIGEENKHRGYAFPTREEWVSHELTNYNFTYTLFDVIVLLLAKAIVTFGVSSVRPPFEAKGERDKTLNLLAFTAMSLTRCGRRGRTCPTRRR